LRNLHLRRFVVGNAHRTQLVTCEQPITRGDSAQRCTPGEKSALGARHPPRQILLKLAAAQEDGTAAPDSPVSEA